MIQNIVLFQTMFEKYQFDSVYVAIQAVLTLYAQGMYFIYNLYKVNASRVRKCQNMVKSELRTTFKCRCKIL